MSYGADLRDVFVFLAACVVALLVACVILSGVAFGWWDGCPDFLTMCARAAAAQPRGA